MPLKRVSVLKRVSFLDQKPLKERELGWRWAVYICGTNNKNLILWSQFFKRNSLCKMSQGHLMSSLVLNRVAKDDFCAKRVIVWSPRRHLYPKTTLSAAPGFYVPQNFFMSKGREEPTVYGLTEKTGSANRLQINNNGSTFSSGTLKPQALTRLSCEHSASLFGRLLFFFIGILRQMFHAQGSCHASVFNC